MRAAGPSPAYGAAAELRTAYLIDLVDVPAARAAVERAKDRLRGLPRGEAMDLRAWALAHGGWLAEVAGDRALPDDLDEARRCMAAEPAVTEPMVFAIENADEALQRIDLLEDRLALTLEAVAREVDDMRARGYDRQLIVGLEKLSEGLLSVGDVAGARAAVLEARALAGSPDVTRTSADAAIRAAARIDLHEGRVPNARLAVHSLLARGATGDDDIELLRLLGAVELADDRPGPALDALDRAASIAERSGIQDPAVTRTIGDHIEAAILTDRVRDATALTESATQRARERPRPWLSVVAARGRAIVAAAGGDLDTASLAIEEAVIEATALGQPLELGRTRLEAGRIERRRKHKRAAHDHLIVARETFLGIAAAVWVTRADRELARVGLRPRAPRELTEIELRVAELVALGQTNRQIAAAVFLSPRSVESVIPRITDKLGVRARAEVGLALAARRPPGAQIP